MGLINDLTDQAISLIKFDICDDTFVHQTNRKFCVAFLIAVSVLVCGKQYVGEPISCFCPAQFEKFHVAYTNSYCWIRNTYSVPFDEILPVEDIDRKNHEILYYQWVPLIFVLLAAMFYLPRVVWKGMNGYSGIDIKKILLLTNAATTMSPKKRDERLWDIVSYVDKWTDIRDGRSPMNRRFRNFQKILQQKGIHSGNYLNFAFVFTCFLYLLNSFGQLFLVNALLGNDFLNLGPEFLYGFSNNRKWEDLRRFPRVAFCDMDIRQLQNVQRWTIQCTLPINLFNEKSFILLWFVLIAMTIVNGVYLIFNIIMLIFPKRKKEYVQKYMDLHSFPQEVKNNAKLPEVQMKFIHIYLRQDGVFLMWLISQNTSQVLAAELVEKLWINYCRKPYVQTFLSLSENEDF